MGGEPLLRELWGEYNENHEREKTPEPEYSREERAFFSIREQIDSLKDEAQKKKLTTLFKALKKSVLEYTIAIDRLAKHKLQNNIDRIEAADRRRSLSHNALIDNLNILSRQFNEAGLDNNWRDDIGLDRKRVTAWALAVAETIREEASKEAGLENEP